jgi:acyl-coenzyme A synthetase/AMP-(fatty) acid ligase
VQVADSGMLDSRDVVLSGIPFADVLGLNGVLGPALRRGATVVTYRGTDRHDLLRSLQDHRVTVAVLPVRMIEILAREPSALQYNLRSLRWVISTGGPLRPEAARACSQWLGCPVGQAYGLTEAAGFTHVNLRAAEERTLDSIGSALPSVSGRIIDPATGTEQPAYQAGELRLSGSVIAGPRGQWLATGDAAFADEHGRVYLMGRVGQWQAEPSSSPAVPATHPAVSEAFGPDAVLAAHPAVSDAVVVPVPHPELGLTPHVFVVLREAVSLANLLTYVNSHVPSHLRIAAIHSVEAIPRSPGGRVLRRALLKRVRLP